MIDSMVRESPPLFPGVLIAISFYVDRDASFTYPTVGANVPVLN